MKTVTRMNLNFLILSPSLIKSFRWRVFPHRFMALGPCGPALAGLDWFCFNYSMRQSLVAWLEAVFARIFFRFEISLCCHPALAGFVVCAAYLMFETYDSYVSELMTHRAWTYDLSCVNSWLIVRSKIRRDSWVTSVHSEHLSCSPAAIPAASACDMTHSNPYQFMPICNMIHSHSATLIHINIWLDKAYLLLITSPCSFFLSFFLSFLLGRWHACSCVCHVTPVSSEATKICW